MTRRYIRFFDEIGIEDVPLVGGKNASLGEMYRNLSSQGVKVPNGFAITAEAYRDVLEQARAWGPLHAALDDLPAHDVAELTRRGRRAREAIGLTNIKLMIPFCRRVEEGAQVVQRMRELGLERGKNGLEIYVMCEIPNNVLLIDEFSQVFDGFSIGSNDLTQLTLGVDRDSELVAFDFDERDPGVLQMIRLAIEGCRRNNRHSGLCGQAPSDYPEVAEYLVRQRIDSISLNPDVVVKTTLRILELEKALDRMKPLATATPLRIVPAQEARK
jgi:phosphoenolpyruvate synthase/pyruvate phosphate dikinase